MADTLTLPERNEVSARMSNAAQAFAMIKYPLSSDYGVTSATLVGESLNYSVGSTGTAGENKQCDDSLFCTFLSRGFSSRRGDLEPAITNTQSGLSAPGETEGKAGGLKIKVGQAADGQSVNVTYSLISHAPETKKLSEEQLAAIKDYEDGDLDAEVNAQLARMGAGSGSHATGSQGGSSSTQ
jgi:hypothetical protein